MLDTFLITLINVLISLAFMIPAYVLGKLKKVSAAHLGTMSTVLVFICSPCMVINSFLTIEFNISDMINMLIFFGVTLLLQGIFLIILFFSLKKKYDDPKYRLFTISSVCGNVGFFGLPLVNAVLGPGMASCYSAIYVMSMNVIAFTVGVFCLTNDKKYMSIKSAFVNPTGVAILISIPLYLLNVGTYMTGNWVALKNGIELLGKMTTPLCMIILGIRLSTVVLKNLFTRPYIYLICAFKMVIFPLFCYLLVVFIPGLDYTFKASILILSSVPCASVILNLAEMHHSEEELAANCVLVSTLLCFITIPLILLIL